MTHQKQRAPGGLQRSILLKLGAANRLQVLGTEQFWRRYGPVIKGFAREIGISAAESVGLINDVVNGFYQLKPAFVYDAEFGGFRSYLLQCTLQALAHRLTDRSLNLGWDRQDLAAEADVIEQLWTDAWEEHLVPRAIQTLREQLADDRAFAAFWRHAVLAEEPDEVAARLHLPSAQVCQTSQRLSAELDRIVRQIRREEE